MNTPEISESDLKNALETAPPVIAEVLPSPVPPPLDVGATHHFLMSLTETIYRRFGRCGPVSVSVGVQTEEDGTPIELFMISFPYKGTMHLTLSATQIEEHGVNAVNIIFDQIYGRR